MAQRTALGSLLRLALGGVIAYEVYLSFGPRRNRRRKLWELAQRRAAQTGKPLVVVGDPDGGVINRLAGRDYECGKLCIDLVGCSNCPEHVTGRLEDVLPTMPADSAVIYVSCTLEYVDDMPQVTRELERVSGGDLFVATVEPMSLTAWLYPGGKRRIFSAPPAGDFKWKPLPWARAPKQLRS